MNIAYKCHDFRELIMQNNIHPGSEWIHYKNKNTYYILGECLLQKDDKWVTGVMYTNEERKLTFVRPLEEFKIKFNKK